MKRFLSSVTLFLLASSHTESWGTYGEHGVRMDSVLLLVSAAWEGAAAGKEEITNLSWHVLLPAWIQECGRPWAAQAWQ